MNQYDPIRKNLKDFQVPIDKDKLWANTAHAIPQKRKKRGAFFVLLGGALLISSAVTFYALSTSENNTNNKAEIQSASIPSVATPANETNDNTNQATTGNITTPDTTQISNHELKPNAKNVTEISNPQASADKTTTPSSRSNGGKLTASNLKNSSENVSAKAANPAGHILPTETRVDASSKDPEIPVAETLSNQVTTVNTLEAANLDMIPALRNADYLSNSLPTLPVSELLILPREDSPADVKGSRSKNKKRINLLVMQGFGWSTMKMTTDNPELQPTIDAWKNNMSSLENLSTSLQASIRLPKGIQLGAGLQYSTLTTQMEYQQSATEEYTEQGITEIIIDEQGNVQNLMGDVKVHRQTILYSTRFTSHARLDVEGIVSIPVIRNYRTETGVWVKVGYNVLYDAKGTTFSLGEVPIKFSSAENPYTLQSPFTFGAGIGTLYRLNPHWNLNARVGCERLRYTHGLYDDQISFHHSIFSLGLGIGYTF